ncbi:NAD(P)/FAD-dependent oxidoreductase [Chloroflexia bacterium SDU3-3]|nr:NAD(P)/FAD-dependent oxidoreductase [Chloroflexia bacterium SDU3-3]
MVQNTQGNPTDGVAQAPISHRVGGTRPRVVVVGAGFGGLNVAKALGGQPVDVLILDRNNYHGFWPLLYQVATAGLEPESIASAVRGIIRRHSNIDFLMTEVSGVDFAQKRVITEAGRVPYDYLVLAAGSANNYFGNDELAKYTFGLKDIDEAELLRNQVLGSFERAMCERDPERRRAMMTFVVIGGGPTGVELVGAFEELIRHVLKKDYPALDVREAKVVLLEAADKLLAPFPASLQRKALKRLTRMGVEVRLQAAVAEARQGEVALKDGTVIRSDTVVWAAGVRAAKVADALGVEQARGARVKITPTLTLPDKPEVFVIGDMAYLEGYKPGVAYPMVAPVAVQMGKLAAENILRSEQGEPQHAFHYFDKGQMATIGRSSAVFDSFGIRMSGFVAWVGWLFVHLLYLIGFRNRLIVMTNWAYNYFTYDRGVRLISGLKRQPAEAARPAVDAFAVDAVAVAPEAVAEHS